MSETFVLLKPETIYRGSVGEIISRFERKGLQIRAISQKVATAQLLEAHYAEHRGKPFFESLVQSMAEQNVICIVLYGPTADTVALVRAMVGDADPLKRLPGTIRFDYSCEKTKNFIHASDSSGAAIREKSLWMQ